MQTNDQEAAEKATKAEEAEVSAQPLFIEESEHERGFAYSEFWKMAGGFWSGASRRTAFLFTGVIILLVLGNIAVQYAINQWNRYFFDALEAKNVETASNAVLLFLGLAVIAIVIQVGQVFFRLGLQARWRRWLTSKLVGEWLEGRRFYQLNIAAPDLDGPEFRMTDDVKIATEPIADFAVGITNAVLMALVFVGVLWSAGGSITVYGVTIPGYFVLVAAAYGLLTSTLMVTLGKPLIKAMETKNAAEAKSRFELVRIRENAESIALIGGEKDEKDNLNATLAEVLERWRTVIRNQSLLTIIIHGNGVLAPVVPLLLGAPKYLAGTMSLGELMQIAAAFVQVQIAFNWLVENYIRLAEWSASARRVVILWRTLTQFQRNEDDQTRITSGESPDENLRLSNLSVAHHTGRTVINGAEAMFAPSEKVLIQGESGTGKSTLIRAIAGLWPWGSGEVLLPQGASVMFVPQRPYVPNGTLRQALLYPGPPIVPDDNELKTYLMRCGLRHLTERLDDEERWDKILSGGEQQRFAFTRLLVHRPQIIIMDEATAALDEASQESMMWLFREELASSMVISVGHRPGLDQYHDRVIHLTKRSRGAEMVEKSAERGRRGRLGRLLGRSLRPRPSPDPASESAKDF